MNNSEKQHPRSGEYEPVAENLLSLRQVVEGLETASSGASTEMLSLLQNTIEQGIGSNHVPANMYDLEKVTYDDLSEIDMAIKNEILAIIDRWQIEYTTNATDWIQDLNDATMTYDFRFFVGEIGQALESFVAVQAGRKIRLGYKTAEGIIDATDKHLLVDMRSLSSKQRQVIKDYRTAHEL